MVDIKILNPDGTEERIRRTPAVQTRAEAERVERALRHELEARSSKSTGRNVEIPTLNAFWQTFFATHVIVNNKPSEVATKVRVMEGHLLPRYGALRLNAIQAQHIEMYKAEMVGLAYKNKTVNNHLTVLRTILKTAEHWDIISKAPRIKLMRVGTQNFRFLDFQELQQLLAVEDASWRSLIELAVNSGLRIGELLALRWKDVDGVAGQLTVCRSDWLGTIGTPKSGKTRIIPINDGAKAALMKQSKVHELVFCHASGQRFTYRQANYGLEQICKKAGLAPLQWHALRHTFASHLVMRGVPLSVVQNLLGHSTQAMTERYAHLTPAVKRHAVTVLDTKTDFVG
jgi:integrase